MNATPQTKNFTLWQRHRRTIINGLLASLVAGVIVMMIYSLSPTFHAVYSLSSPMATHEKSTEKPVSSPTHAGTAASQTEEPVESFVYFINYVPSDILRAKGFPDHLVDEIIALRGSHGPFNDRNDIFVALPETILYYELID